MNIAHIHESVARAALSCGPPRKLAHPWALFRLGLQSVKFLK